MNILKLSFLFASIASLSAMENQAIKPWVKNATKVTLRTMKMSYDVNISDDTTVLDIKEIMESNEGIPVVQQKIRAIYSRPYTLGLLQNEADIADDYTNVKKVMNQYNTDLLALYLTLKNRPAN